MKIYLNLWIFICGLLFHLKYATSNTTVTESSSLNLVIESSTSTNFDKQLKTNIDNSSDLFSSNNVNTGPLHSSSTSEECKNGDCTSRLHTSPSTDNSSSASKILWNLVSTAKSTTAQPSVSDETDINEGSTLFSLETIYGAHSYNNSNVHNSSYYFNNNELDSEVNPVNDMLEIRPTYSDEIKNNTFPIHSFENLTTYTTESSVITTEVMMNMLNNLEGNGTVDWESTEIHSQTVTSSSNDSDLFNMTEYKTTSNTEVITDSTDAELDFTTHFLDSSYSFDISSAEELDMKSTQEYHTENSASEISYSPSDASLNSEYNDSSTVLSVNNDSSTEPSEFESSESELYKSYSMSNIPLVLENKENSTSFYLDYDTFLDSEEGKSKDIHQINITDSGTNKYTSPSVSDTSTETTLYKIIEETYNTTLSGSTTDKSTMTTELYASNTDLETTTLTLSTEEQATSSEDGMLYYNSETAENTESAIFVTNNTYSTEEIDYAFNFTQEIHESTSESGLVQSFSNNLDDSSEQFTEKKLMDDVTTSVYVKSITSSDYSLPQESKTSQSEVSPTTENFISLIDSSERSSDKFDAFDSHDLSLTEREQNTSLLTSSGENEQDLSTHTSVTPNTDPNINIVYLNTVRATSTQTPHYTDNVNEINNNLSSVQTNHDVSPDSTFQETSTVFSVTADSSITVLPVKEISFETEISVATHTPDILSNSNSEIEKIYIMMNHTNSDEIFTSTESLQNETYVSRQSPDTILTTSGKETKYNLVTDNLEHLTNSTEDVSVGVHVENTAQILTKSPDTLETTNSTESVLTSSHFSINPTISYSEDPRHSVTESNSPEMHQTEDTMKTTSSEKIIVKQVNFSESDIITDTKHFDTIPISTTPEVDKVTTAPTFSEISSLSVTETYREGKHIPFSSTLVKITTEHPRILNGTGRTYSRPPQSETTDKNFINSLYSQIEAEELSPEERSNLINAIVKLPDKYYTKEELNEKVAIIHLWFLHAVADEYKNTTLSSPGSNAGELDEIEFENLPQILYVLPTPDYTNVPNISFTFVVYNKWRNATFPVDIVLTILNLHIENLKHLVEIEEIHFSHDPFVQKHDLLSVIIEKYGIVLLSTCLLTVVMIMLLVCVVIYYRRKTRHSAHCLTDDKLHRNMQEAMGIDLNPAVIILQDEIREKAALNGNKICSLDDDEGWLAPIGDVPVEDNNAPFVQDTKL